MIQLNYIIKLFTLRRITLIYICYVTGLFSVYIPSMLVLLSLFSSLAVVILGEINKQFLKTAIFSLLCWLDFPLYNIATVHSLSPCWNLRFSWQPWGSLNLSFLNVSPSISALHLADCQSRRDHILKWKILKGSAL